MVQPIHRWVAAWIASCRFDPACSSFSTSSAKWRPWRLSRNSLTDSRGWQVASEIAVIAIGQAAWASSFIVPQKPQASFWKVGICLVVVIVFRSEEHTSELQSLMRNSYAVFCLKKKKKKTTHNDTIRTK